jgi:hypothetical protein
MGIKNTYLDILHGVRGVERYANYPVYYALNTPRSVARHAHAFAGADFINLTRIGAEDYNLPRFARPLNRAVDRLLNVLGAPGSNLAFRLVRAPRGCAAPEARPEP